MCTGRTGTERMSEGCVYTKIRTMYICGTLMMWAPVPGPTGTRKRKSQAERMSERGDEHGGDEHAANTLSTE